MSATKLVAEVAAETRPACDMASCDVNVQINAPPLPKKDSQFIGLVYCASLISIGVLVHSVHQPLAAASAGC